MTMNSWRKETILLKEIKHTEKYSCLYMEGVRRAEGCE